jgi:hypothetical protein
MPGSFCAVTRPRNVLAAAALIAMLGAGCDPPPTQIPPGQGAAPPMPLPKEAANPPPAAPIELTEADAGAPSGGAASGAASGSAGRGSGSQAGSGAAPGTGTGTSPGTRPPPAGAGSGAGAPVAGTGKGVRDGGSCERGEQCASGICEGFGCGGDRPGTCMSRNRSCTRDLRQFCGCDGKTFQGSGSCPGRRFSARRACR